MKTIQHGTRYRIYPTTKQKQYLTRNIGCARKLYNLYVEEGNARDEQAIKWHENHDEPYPYKWHQNTYYIQQYPYLRNADSLSLMNARKAYMNARQKHFSESAGRPNFKSKNKSTWSFTTNNQGYKTGKGTIWIETDNKHKKQKSYLYIPKLKQLKLGGIPIRLHRPIDGDIINVTITHERSGEWYASILIDTGIPVPSPVDEISTAFGGDLGITTFLTGSDGISYDDPHDYDRVLARLRVEERKLGKSQARHRKNGDDLRDCRNYQKQRVRVARLRERVRRMRSDFRHKLSRHLVDTQDLVCLEDLDVSGMMRNHRLARSVAGQSWSDFVRLVRYKGEWSGSRVVLVSRWFPSSRRCSSCGCLTGPRGFRGLGVREWVCPICGVAHDRDSNASVNVLLEGLRLCGVGSSELVLNRRDGGVSLVRTVLCGGDAGVYTGGAVCGVIGEPAVPRKCAMLGNGASLGGCSHNQSRA